MNGICKSHHGQHFVNGGDQNLQRLINELQPVKQRLADMRRQQGKTQTQYQGADHGQTQRLIRKCVEQIVRRELVNQAIWR